MKLDRLIQSAREDAPVFEGSFERVVARHERRRNVRRVIVAASAVAIATLLLLRVGSSSAEVHAEEPTVVATSVDGDAGFARD